MALGLVLLAIPGAGGSYWTTFFPAITVLGFGMAISIAPVTTTVMGAVDQRFAGLASGINNTASRIAGAVAVAIMGVVILGVFEARLDDRLENIPLLADAVESLDEETVNLAAAKIPTELDAETTAQVQAAIDDSFVSAFRVVAVTSSIVALASAALAAVMIEGKLAPASVRDEENTGQLASTPTRSCLADIYTMVGYQKGTISSAPIATLQETNTLSDTLVLPTTLLCAR